ncbi:MAG TPA: glycoside hydrolase family 2 TIM barrel-domain containing protein [Bryobacteraceae bacterium]|nr:glycoside hydrolase family 2 TIM barrel-domain containing protein [Bryobacteraceae bacterium]
MRSFLLSLTLAVVATAAPAAVSENLARSAQSITASAAADSTRAAEAADGSLGTVWSPAHEAAGGAWLEFAWSRAVTIREVVVRQSGDGGATGMTVEIWRDGAWHRTASFGDGANAVPVFLLAEFTPETTTRLRIAELRGPVRLAEVEVYEGPTPPWIDVRGDAAGNILGVFTDGWGTAAFASADVAAQGTVRGKPWEAKATTGPGGEFTIPLPVGLAGPVKFTARAGSHSAEKTVDAGDIHQGLVPAPAGATARLALTGAWKFQADPPAGFERAEFNDAAWAVIDVPSHMVMSGLYPESGVGGYRKSIQVPAAWRGQRIRIAFDGVYSGAEVWVNGRRAGSHLGGANPFQLDITSMVRPGAVNVIAVKVSEHTVASDELDHMSQYADFPLAGIFRKAYLLAVPALHVARLHAAPRFDSAYRDARLLVDVTIVNESDQPATAARADFTLARAGSVAPVAKAALADISLGPWQQVRKQIEIPVRSPAHWEAEHPNLYTLRAALASSGQPVETVELRTGFVESRVRGSEFLINGAAVKLKGACHHDSHPLMGRAVTPELERQDIALMKDANLNALRTSHYPPLPELLDIADEQGMFVEAEASFCWVANSYDLRYAALTRQFTAELVERSRSHPSVVLWSAGNESLWGPTLLAGENLIRSYDPTRPVVGSWRRNHFDMRVMHNPMDLPLLEEIADSPKPIDWDESLAISQGIWGDGKEMWHDPGVRDYYVEPLGAVMEAFQTSKSAQASFIWAWSDDIFSVPGRGYEFGRDTTPWQLLTGVYGIAGRGIAGDAPWGVVDAWRRPKPEFWHVKKLHSPVVVRTAALARPEAGAPLRVDVENRYLFTPFSELKITWEIDGRRGAIRSNLAPRAAGTLEIEPGFRPRPGSELVLRFVDRGGRTVETSALPVGTKPAAAPVRETVPLRVYEEESLSGRMLRVVGRGFELGFDRATGTIRRATANGRAVLYQGPALHILPAEPFRPQFPSAEAWKLSEPLEIERGDDRVVLVARGKYPDLEGSFRTTIEASGEITVDYDFGYSGAELQARETGIRLGLPLTEDTLEWERKGEWNYYPADHIGRLRGSAKAHANHPAAVPPAWPFAQDDTPLGTNDFRSTKRNFLTASFKDANGYGIALSSGGSAHLRAILESDRIAVHVNDFFGGMYSRDEWRQYGAGRKLAPGTRLQGTLKFHFVSGKTAPPLAHKRSRV